MTAGTPIPLHIRAAAIKKKRQKEKLVKFENPDLVQWIEDHFWIPEANNDQGGPIELMDYQKAVLREATRRGPDGKYIYTIVIWSDIKKSAKSTIAAARALWAAFQIDWGNIKIVANDLKQADSRVAYYLRRAVELNPALREMVYMKPSGYLVRLPNRTQIEAIPLDPGGEAGGNDDLIVFSELWGFRTKAALRMWTEMTLSPTKEGFSQRWVETYAGYSGESVQLEQLYETGVKGGEKIGAEIGYPDLELYRNKAASMLTLWNEVPRCPWQTPSYYASEASILTETEFNRVHRNQWASSEQKFIPIEWWDASRVDEMPAMVRNDTPCILVADAAVSGDTFGVLMLTGRRDLPGYEPETIEVINEDGEKVIINIERYDVRYAYGWVPPKGGEIDYQGTEEEPGPEKEIRRLLDTHNVVEFVYDPFQLHDMGGRLANDLVARTYAFAQGQDRLIADKGLYDKIKTHRVHHLGDVVLREHIENANAKIDGEDRKLRLVKRAEHLKIDLAVCLSMGVARASFWQL